MLTVGMIFLIWGIWPARKAQRLVEISNDQIPGVVVLKVAWPESLPAGSRSRIILGLEASDPFGSEDKPDALRSIIEARLELPGIDFIPMGVIRQVYDPDKSLEFAWQTLPRQSADYSGTIWLHLITQPLEGNNVENRVLLSVQPVKVHAKTLFGLDAYRAQVIGTVGVVLGAALCIDLLLVPFKLWMRNNNE